jgi:hypothetical protein
MVSAKVAGEAHADGADAASAAFPMREARKGAQPLRDWTCLIGRERSEFRAETGAFEDRHAFLDLRHGFVAAEQRRHLDRESGIADPTGETGQMRADPGHLHHHDDGGA